MRQFMQGEVHQHVIARLSRRRGAGMTRVAILSLCLVCFALPSLAQSSGAHWSITYTYNGTSIAQKNGVGPTVSWPTNGPLPNPTTDFEAGDSILVTLSGTITATMRWVDANGNPTPTLRHRRRSMSFSTRTLRGITV